MFSNTVTLQILLLCAEYLLKIQSREASLDAKPLLTKFLTEDDFNALGLVVSTAYKACSQFMARNVVTGTFPVGKELRPHLLRAFVDHSLMKLADQAPGFVQEVRPNIARNCHHVRIQKGGLVLTAHYMGRKSPFRRMARFAVNRKNLSARNGELFDFESKDLDAFGDFGYAQILHGGYSSPELLLLVIP